MKPQPPKIDGDSGMTMVELLVVLAIIGLATTLAMPSLRGPSRTVDLRAHAVELTSHLRSARATAIARNQPVEFHFNANSRVYNIDGHARGVTLPDNMTMTMTTARELIRTNSDARLAFFADGSSSGGEIRLTDGARTLVVVVDWLTGTVRLTEARP
jgi:general secretion pathway protein H